MTVHGNTGHGCNKTTNLLIVDDEAAVRTALKRAAASLGLTSTAASSVREALARCRLRHFDLALVDVLMPVNDGIKLLMRLKKLLPSMPVAVMSDGGRIATEDYLVVARQLGAAHALWKPVDAKSLRALLVTLGLEGEPSARGAGETRSSSPVESPGTHR